MPTLNLIYLSCTCRFRLVGWEELRPGDLVYAAGHNADPEWALGPYTVLDPARRLCRNQVGQELVFPADWLPLVQHLEPPRAEGARYPAPPARLR